jgi:hypothetical protein
MIRLEFSFQKTLSLERRFTISLLTISTLRKPCLDLYVAELIGIKIFGWKENSPEEEIKILRLRLTLQ